MSFTSICLELDRRYFLSIDHKYEIKNLKYPNDSRRIDSESRHIRNRYTCISGGYVHLSQKLFDMLMIAWVVL